MNLRLLLPFLGALLAFVPARAQVPSPLALSDRLEVLEHPAAPSPFAASANALALRLDATADADWHPYANSLAPGGHWVRVVLPKGFATDFATDFALDLGGVDSALLLVPGPQGDWVLHQAGWLVPRSKQSLPTHAIGEAFFRFSLPADTMAQTLYMHWR